MSGYQIGTYNPPSLNMLEKKKEEIHLLDIDFEDVKIEDHKVEYNNSSLLDFSDVDIKKEPIQSSENKLSDVFTTQTNRPKLDDDDDDINANSSLIDNEKKEGDILNKADLEENKANIVEQPSGYDRYMNFEYYKQFFDITTEEAIIRLRNACVPFFYQGSIFEGKIDLYCPIWVIITLNVTITIFGNMARYIKFETSNDEKQYKSDVKNFTKNVPLITMYATIFYRNIFLKKIFSLIFQ